MRLEIDPVDQAGLIDIRRERETKREEKRKAREV